MPRQLSERSCCCNAKMACLLGGFNQLGVLDGFCICCYLDIDESSMDRRTGPRDSGYNRYR